MVSYERASYSLSYVLALRWRRSSASAANGNCVEVAPVPSGWLIRDSKHTGPSLAVGAAAWAALLSRAGRPPG
ncbi:MULTISPECIES: DUF397 domain-containing protein [Actinokineospora]|uniref:DUF397 domain-containing protein n=1 Tax=Actinokineospora fastidiosa TaxID=1816 RepID=A0A918G7D7_9PSEU|nr:MULTISPECIES: DUF397 domain-containing protein [Actinokineospora]UVS82496.1 hypothetical protein Actkin_06269 [Actinokineospora sp. UTMC 2448]GGS20707.1 hypothetical protein GCM10010171_11700 [Actinokineospora fastidiosa]